jgi:hypothetical protein
LPVAEPVTEPIPPLLAPTMAPPRAADRWLPSIAGLACAGLIGLAGYAGSWALAGAVLVVTGALAWGWPALLDLPAPRSTSAALGLSAVLATVSVAATRDDPLLDWLALASAGGVMVAFLHQLVRRDGRPRLVESLSGELLAVGLIVCGAALIGLPRTKGGADAVLSLAACAAAAFAIELVPLPERLMAFPLVVGSTAAGGLAAGLVPDTKIAFGAAVGLAYAIAVVCLRRMFMGRPGVAFPPASVALAMAPLAAGGVVTYVLARLFVG